MSSNKRQRSFDKKLPENQYQPFLFLKRKIKVFRFEQNYQQLPKEGLKGFMGKY
jgi:hypothetical protein